MPKYFWVVIFTLAMGIGAATLDSNQPPPPFHEGPKAQRTNQMHEFAPNGPWGPGPF